MKQQATSNKQQATSNKQQATSNKQLVNRQEHKLAPLNLSFFKSAISPTLLIFLLALIVSPVTAFATDKNAPDAVADVSGGDCPSETECIEVVGERPDPVINPCIGGCGGGGGGSGGGGSPGGPVGPPNPPSDPDPGDEDEDEDEDEDDARRLCQLNANVAKHQCRTRAANTYARGLRENCNPMMPDITIFGEDFSTDLYERCVTSHQADRDASFEACDSSHAGDIRSCG
ncbi:hypothetical protein PN836_014340 [Ningiella sp. W23]|uniref:hypothetical protein n=1 Tax=Ningiella sp. W23 TaxID=3023715 RepID=UPI0037569BA6